MNKNGTFEDCNNALMAMRDSIDIWGGKWKILIMLYLSWNKNEKNCFMEIKRNITGISAKMLSKELKDLELNTLVERTVHNTKPITVEYNVTEYGKSFIEIARTLGRWGLKHREVIKSRL